MSFESLESIKKSKASIEKIVNPLGTVTTVTSCLTADVKTDILDEVVSQLAIEENVIHENCDESLFRPVVAIFCDENTRLQNEEALRENSELCQPPETISNRLVVPVIPKEIDDEISKKEKKKTNTSKPKASVSIKSNLREIEQNKFVKHSTLHKSPNEDVQNNKKKDTSQPTCSKLSLLESEEKQNVQSLISENICRKEKKDCIKRLVDKPEVLTKEKNNGIKSVRVEPINVVHSEEKHCEKIKENPTEFKKMIPKPEKVTDELEDCEISETKEKRNEDPNPKIREMTRNTKTKTKSYKNSDLTDDTKKQNTILESEDNVKLQFDPKLTSSISVNVEENAFETAKKPIQESSEIIPASSVLRDKKPTTSIIANKSISIDKNSKKVKMEKDKTIVNKSNDVVVSGELESDLNEIKSYENKPANNKTDELSTAQSHTANTNTNILKNLTVISKQENESDGIHLFDGEDYSVDEKVSAKSVIGECKEHELSNTTCLLASSTDETRTRIKDSKRDQRNKGTMAATSDSKDVKKSVNDGRTKTDNKSMICESREKSNKKSKSENDSTKKISDNMAGKSVVTDKTKSFVPKNKTEESLEKQNISKQSQSEIELEGKSDNNTSMSSKLIQSEEKGKEKNEQKNQNQINSQVKTEPHEDNKNNQSNTIGTGVKDDRKTVGAKNLEFKCIKDDNKTNSSVLSSSKKTEFSKGEQETELSSDDVRSVTVLEAKKEKIEGKTLKKIEKPKLKSNSKDKSMELINDTADSNDNQKTLIKKTLPPIPTTSAWKTLSGSEMMNRNTSKSCTESNKNPSLGASNKWNTCAEIGSSQKLLPELPTPLDMVDQITKARILNKTKISFTLKDDPTLNLLEALPPLPSLEPLQLTSENKSGILRDISLINFESPLQENPALQTKITPPPRGFTEQNLIFALCGSLHYENESMRASSEKLDLSPTFSSNRSSTAVEEPSTTDYKSLTENDDPYMSLEQSSQDTNTTNTNTTNEKFSSSTNSSGSEEIVIMEEKKMTKKQKRKRQQLQELQKQKEQQHQQEMDDEELRPLIAMTESQADQISTGVPGVTDKSNSTKISMKQTFLQSTTTDSEGPMPATTSDDNVFCVPAPMVHNPQKIKTKKLEHKINLIGAIEAATSSSTSSAEESGVEIGGRSSHDNEESLISLSGNITAAALPLAGTTQATVGALKKKSKRRKR